ncbi:MAG TPA: AAA family ATPase [Trinickia sp.]|nr:AAA family ATPase [Trinickia sp.]
MLRKVFFALDSRAGISLPAGSILVLPSSDSWNDFGYQTFFDFVVIDGQVGRKKFHLAFLDSSQKVREVIEAAVQIPGEAVGAHELPEFFSLQTEMERYRELVSEYGPEDAQDILRALHDLVAIRAFEPSASWLDAALNSPHFGMSFVRNSEQNFAFHNAASVLHGVEHEDVQAAPTTLVLEFQLAGFASSHSFDFTFSPTSLPPRRVAVMIGKNGVGKSRALNELVSSAISGGGNFHDGLGNMPRLSRILALCTPGEAEHTFPAEPTFPARFQYKRISSNASAGDQTLPSILVNLSRDKRRIGEHLRWDIFNESVQQIVEFSDLALTVRDDVASHGGLIDVERLWRFGEQASAEARQKVSLRGHLMRRVDGGAVSLSSGQLSFIRLAAQLCTFIENGSLVLMDEPETHLHPNLITGLVAMLHKILTLTGSIAIAATHSAYLVREVPQSQVHIIRQSRESSRVEIIKPRLRTFGADVGAISHFVFGDDIVNRLIKELEPKIHGDIATAEEWLASIEAELSTEAFMLLTREIEKRRGSVQ